jgi:hypothetical protein
MDSLTRLAGKFAPDSGAHSYMYVHKDTVILNFGECSGGNGSKI